MCFFELVLDVWITLFRWPLRRALSRNLIVDSDLICPGQILKIQRDLNPNEYTMRCIRPRVEGFGLFRIIIKRVGY